MNKQLWVVSDPPLIMCLLCELFMNKLICCCVFLWTEEGQIRWCFYYDTDAFLLQNAAQSLKAAMKNGGNVSGTCAWLFCIYFASSDPV